MLTQRGKQIDRGKVVVVDRIRQLLLVELTTDSRKSGYHNYFTDRKSYIC